MDDANDDGGERSESDVLARPSFNDRLTIIDFPMVSGDAVDYCSSTTPAAAGGSPAAVSLHTPTPPNVGDSDETQFNFELVTPPSTHYELHPSPTITTSSEYNSWLSYLVVSARPCFRPSSSVTPFITTVRYLLTLQHNVKTVAAIIMKHKGSRIMPFNSPGGSTLQWGAGRYDTKGHVQHDPSCSVFFS